MYSTHLLNDAEGVDAMLDEVKLSRSFRGVSFNRPFHAPSTETEWLRTFNVVSIWLVRHQIKPQTYWDVGLPPGHKNTHKNIPMFRYVHESINAIRADFPRANLHLRVHSHKSCDLKKQPRQH